MRFRVIKIWTAVVLFLASVPILSLAVSSNTVVLSKLGFDSTSKQRMSQIEQIKEGSTIVFESVLGSQSFRVGKLLGMGNTTYVYELLDHPDKVIRIESGHKWDWRMRYWKKSYINTTIKGYDNLRKAGIPTVKIHDYRYDQYVVVDRMNGFTLEEYLLNFDKHSKEEREKIEAELLEFAKKTMNYSKIDDFRAEQIMYDTKKGWLLTDWTKNAHRYENTYSTVFDTLAELFLETQPPSKVAHYATDLYGKIIREIRKKRGVVLSGTCANLFN